MRKILYCTVLLSSLFFLFVNATQYPQAYSQTYSQPQNLNIFFQNRFNSPAPIPVVNYPQNLSPFFKKIIPSTGSERLLNPLSQSLNIEDLAGKEQTIQGTFVILHTDNPKKGESTSNPLLRTKTEMTYELTGLSRLDVEKLFSHSGEEASVTGIFAQSQPPPAQSQIPVQVQPQSLESYNQLLKTKTGFPEIESVFSRTKTKSASPETRIGSTFSKIKVKSIQFSKKSALRPAGENLLAQVLPSNPKIAIVLFRLESQSANDLPTPTVINDVAQFVASYHAETSFGLLNYNSQPDVFGPFVLSGKDPNNCGSELFNDWTPAIESMAQSIGWSAGNYRHNIFVFPQSNCPFLGAAFINGNFMWINDAQSFSSKRTILHEMGHNLGANHASSLDCEDPQSQFSTAPSNDSNIQCEMNEYGDPSSVMGGGSAYHHLAQHKATFGWLKNVNVKTLGSGEGGTFDIYPRDKSLIGSDQIGLLAVPWNRPPLANLPPAIFWDNGFLYLDYTQPDKWDAFPFDSPFIHGVSLRLAQSAEVGERVFLLDTRPETPFYFDDAPLLTGRSYHDQYNSFTITVLATDQTKATVNISYENCQRSNPTIRIDSPYDENYAGADLHYSTKVTNNNIGNCSAEKFKLTASNLPNGWSASNEEISLANGASLTKSVTVTSPLDTIAGLYQLHLSISSLETTTNNSAIVEAQILPSTCVRKNPDLSIQPPSQTIKTGQSTSYQLKVINKDSADCPAENFVVKSFDRTKQIDFDPPSVIINNLAPGNQATPMVSATPNGFSSAGKITFSTFIKRAKKFGWLVGTPSDLIIEEDTDCGLTEPSLIIKPKSVIASPGQILPVQLRVTNNESKNCPSSLFSVSWELLFDDDFSVEKENDLVTVSPGKSMTVQKIVTFKEEALLGGHEVWFTAKNLASGFSVEDLMTVSLKDPPTCARAAPSAVFIPSSQKGRAGDVLQYDIKITNNDRGCFQSKFSIDLELPPSFQQVADRKPALQPVTLFTKPLQWGESVLENVAVISPNSATDGRYAITAFVRSVNRPAFQTKSRGFYVIGANQCLTSVKPSVKIEPLSQKGKASQTLDFKFNITNNNQCSADYRLTSAIPPLWIMSPSPLANLSLLDKETGVVNFKITSPSNAQIKAYKFSLMATDAGDSSLKATAEAQYEVARCVRNKPELVVSPTTQIGYAGQTLIYNLSVKDKNSACDPTRFNFNVQLPNKKWQSEIIGAELKITSPADAKIGLHQFSVTASDVNAPTSKATVNISYDVQLIAITKPSDNSQFQSGKSIKIQISPLNPNDRFSKVVVLLNNEEACQAIKKGGAYRCSITLPRVKTQTRFSLQAVAYRNNKEVGESKVLYILVQN